MLATDKKNLSCCRFVCGLVVLLALLTACSSIKTAATPVPHPNEVSTYLFSAGDVLYFYHDFGGATELYRMSHNFDTNSFTIKEAIFKSLLIRVLNNQIPVEEFEGYADSLMAEAPFTQDMLEQTYNVYLQTSKLQKAKQNLDIYLKKYESPRAYTSLFFLREQLEGKKDFKLLQKARQLAGTDADFLNTLGSLYAVYDSTQAAKTWLLARQYDTTDVATVNLWNLYALQKDYPALRKLYASFVLPEDQERQTNTVASALKAGDFLSLTNLQPQIFASGQPEQILALLQASWYTNQDDIFQMTLDKLATMNLSKPQIQVKSAFAACWLLKMNKPEAIKAIALLDGKGALDEFLQLYRAYNDGEFETASKQTTYRALLRLNQLLVLTPSSVLAAPVKDYMILLSDSLQTNPEFTAPDEVALPCVMYFYDNNRKTYDTYLWLGQYYNRKKMLPEQTAILKEALDTFPDDAALLNWLGYSYITQKEHLDEAESLVQRALQLSPDNAFYLDSMGWLLYLKGDYKDALDEMEIPKTLEKIPSEIAWHIASIYLALGDKDNAAVYAKKAIETNDDPEFVQKAGEMLKTLP